MPAHKRLPRRRAPPRAGGDDGHLRPRRPALSRPRGSCHRPRLTALRGREDGAAPASPRRAVASVAAGLVPARDDVRERRRHQGRLPHSPGEAASGRVAGETGRPRWAGHSFARRLRGQAEARKELREHEGGFPSWRALEREHVERREGAVHQGDGRGRDSATSRAETPSTSRSRSTARLAREKCWSAAESRPSRWSCQTGGWTIASPGRGRWVRPRRACGPGGDVGWTTGPMREPSAGA